LYLGATDITADGNWKWLRSGEEAKGPADHEDYNMDCSVWRADTNYAIIPTEDLVNCEKNSEETYQIANICFAKAEA